MWECARLREVGGSWSPAGSRYFGQDQKSGHCDQAGHSGHLTEVRVGSLGSQRVEANSQPRAPALGDVWGSDLATCLGPSLGLTDAPDPLSATRGWAAVYGDRLSLASLSSFSATRARGPKG